MTTLIAVYNSSGCIGRCDAKCYNAEHDDCECICGGVNHGVGHSKAAENTREMAERWIDIYQQTHQDDGFRADIPARQPVQLTLF